MVLLQIGCPPLPLTQYTVTLLQQKALLRERSKIPFVKKILIKMTEPAPSTTAAVFPEHFQGRETANLKLKVNLSWSQQTSPEDRR